MTAWLEDLPWPMTQQPFTPRRGAPPVSAESLRRGQCDAKPPSDSPWCFYDLAEILLYQRRPDELLACVDLGIQHSVASWQIDTFLKSLRELAQLNLNLPGLPEAIEKLEKD